MGLIRRIFGKIEELENQVKILEGKLNKLTVNIDVINTTPKILPDALTYKPQQPYGIDSKARPLTGITFDKIREFEHVPENDIEVKVEGKILKFINRPMFSIYYPG